MSSIIRATTTSGLQIAPDNSGSLQLQTNGTTTAVTIDTSQNVGIGTSTVASGRKLQVEASGDTIQRINSGGASSGLGIEFANNGTLRGGIGNGSGNISGGSATTLAIQAVNEMVFASGGYSERMRIDSSGNVLVGTTSVPTNGASGAGSATFNDSINVKGITSHAGVNGAYQTNRINFQWNGSATRLWVDTTDTGSITVSSDYRVKKDIETQTQNALSRIALIRPVTYTYSDYEPFSWKADGVSREGFIAHELQVVVPSAVEGEKDAENQIQSLKLDALCSVMVKAIQEQQTIINNLKARIETLEAK